MEADSADFNLSQRLQVPSHRMGGDELRKNWFHDKIVVCLSGLGHLANHPALAHKIQGALAHVLRNGASTEARAGMPCSWTPPCALDIFFREQGTFGHGVGIPKPYVIALVQHGQDLRLILSIFGFATDWSAALAERLPEALLEHIDWQILAKEVFAPAAKISKLSITSHNGLHEKPVPNAIFLEFDTPLNAEGRNSLLNNPEIIIKKLLFRIESMARWFDVALNEDWHTLSKIINGLDYDLHDLRLQTTQRIVEHSVKKISIPTAVGSIRIAGPLAKLWPYLQIGQTTNIGKGSTVGFGRYFLVNA